MKIIHIITGLGGGGAEKMLVRLVTSGHRDRFEHVVVSLTDEGVHGAALHAGGIRLITLGMNRSVTDIRRIFRLRGLLLQEQPDLIQTWLYHSDLLGFVVGKLAGIATIGWNIRCSDMELQHYGFLTRVSRRILALLSPLVSFAIVNSAAGRDFHVNLGFRCRRWEWISNGFDLTDLRPDPDARTAVRAELGVSADTHVIGMLARFNKQKDQPVWTSSGRMTPCARPSSRPASRIESTSSDFDLMCGEFSLPATSSRCPRLSARVFRMSSGKR